MVKEQNEKQKKPRGSTHRIQTNFDRWGVKQTQLESNWAGFSFCLIVPTAGLKEIPLLEDMFRIVLWLVGGLLMCSNAGVSAGTVAHYRFSDGRNGSALIRATDSSTNHLDGFSSGGRPLTFTNDAPRFSSAGSMALDASGDYNFAKVPHDPRLVLTQSWTVELFLKVRTPHGSFGGAIGDPELYTIAAKQNNPGFGRYLAAWSVNFGPKTGHVFADVGFGNEAGVGIESQSRVDDGRWHHVAFRLKRDFQGGADALSLHLDGKLEALLVQELPQLFYGAEPLYLGAGNFGSDPVGTNQFRRNFDGYIDELRISDTALSREEFLDWLAAKDPLLYTRLTNNFQVLWNSTAGQSYQLQKASSLDGKWTNIGARLTGSGSVLSLGFPPALDSKAFYRLTSPQQGP